jgi:uncharacterized membrane protein YdbT with pleckstrin-like domain
MRGLKRLLLKIIWKPKINEAEPSFVSPSFLILPKEKIIFKTNPHWLFMVVPEVGLAVMAILILKCLSYFLIEQIRIQRLILVLFGAAWSIVMIIIFLDWICTKYYLTNLRLVEERGIIGKRIMSIWLNKVQDVTCKFGILGRIFGFGDIEIESAGTYGKIVFDRIPSPRKFQKEIEKASLDLHFRYSSKGL